MPVLIGLPRATWRQQPTGIIEANPSNSLFQELLPEALFVPRGNELVDLMGKYSVDRYDVSTGLTNTGVPDVRVGRSGFGAYTPTKSDTVNSAGTCWRSTLYPSSSTRTLINLYQLLTNVTTSAYLVNGSHDSTNTRRFFAGAGASTTTTGIMYGYGNSFVNTTAGSISAGLINTVHCTALSSNGSTAYGYYDGRGLTSFSATFTGTCNRPVFLGSRSVNFDVDNFNIVVTPANLNYITLVSNKFASADAMREFWVNPWQLFRSNSLNFYLIPSSSGSSATILTNLDALIQKSFTRSLSIDALLQSIFSSTISVDALIAAVRTGVMSLDALLQIVGTRQISIDALLQATKIGTVSVDALVQMTLAPSISLDALIVAASASSASVNLDALIQSFKTAGLSVDALLSKSMSATAVMDALIQASKTGAVSLDAIITGASSASIFVGLDALVQSIQSKTLSVDALLQKAYTNSLSLDAYIALTRTQSVSLDAMLQATQTGAISLDALIQMTRTTIISFDALIQAAKTGVMSLDAILIFATQSSVLLDAYVQKTLSAGVGLDAIIGAIAAIIMPTGRVVTIPYSDRLVTVSHSDRLIVL